MYTHFNFERTGVGYCTILHPTAASVSTHTASQLTPPSTLQQSSHKQAKTQAAKSSHSSEIARRHSSRGVQGKSHYCHFTQPLLWFATVRFLNFAGGRERIPNSLRTTAVLETVTTFWSSALQKILSASPLLRPGLWTAFEVVPSLFY